MCIKNDQLWPLSLCKQFQMQNFGKTKCSFYFNDMLLHHNTSLAENTFILVSLVILHDTLRLLKILHKWVSFC